MTVPHETRPLAAASIPAAIATLRARGLRVSAARRLVIEALFAAEGPVRAEAIAGGLDGRLPDSDLASVYRNLDTLEEIGLVRHFHLGHGPGLYALAGRPRPATPRASAAARTRARPDAVARVAAALRERLRLRGRGSPTSRSSGAARTAHHDRGAPCTFLTASSAPRSPRPAPSRRPAPSPTDCGARAVELDERRVPLLGVTAAFVFAAQMLNFPVAGGTSGHFLGAALAAILLGPWLAGLVLSVVLVVQAFVFADGGITALGANVLNMGVIGALRRRRPDGRRRSESCRTAAACCSRSPASARGWRSWPAPRPRRSSWRSPARCRSAPSCRRCSACTSLIGAGEAAITVAAVSAVLSTRPDVVRAFPVSQGATA